MATEPVNQSASLPTYPEMIMGAIDALKGKEGSNKSAIASYIESTYSDLPAGHMNSLNEHLSKLKEDGELVLVKNNYMRPDPNAPPKRGRGRPPKAKDNAAEVPVAAATGVAVPAAVADGPSRGRGRPRKDPNAPPSVKKAKVEKPKEDEKEDDKEDPTPSKSGRPRGRPRKVQPALGQNGVEAN